MIITYAKIWKNNVDRTDWRGGRKLHEIMNFYAEELKDQRRNTEKNIVSQVQAIT
jgi:hypothetical protein